MIRILTVFALIFNFCTCASIVVAQRNEKDTAAAPIFEILLLFASKDVRVEVGISDEHFLPLDKLFRNCGDQLPTTADYVLMEPPERAEALKSIERRTNELDREAGSLADELLSPEQFSRLIGLYIQQEGALALLNPIVSKRLSLKETQIQEIEKKLAELRNCKRSLTRKLTEAAELEASQPHPATKEYNKLQSLKKELESALQFDTDAGMREVESILEPSQRERLVAIRGERFIRQGSPLRRLTFGW